MPPSKEGAFYVMENMVLRKRGSTFGPEIFTGESWKPYGNTFAFDHGAMQVTEAEAKQAILDLFGHDDDKPPQPSSPPLA